MSDERDPLLKTLFAETEWEPADDDFNAEVMANVERRRRNVLIGRVVIFGLLIVFEALLSSPLQNSVGVITNALGTSLIEVNDSWVAIAVSPLNSIAGLIGMLLLGLHTLYRRMVR